MSLFCSCTKQKYRVILVKYGGITLYASADRQAHVSFIKNTIISSSFIKMLSFCLRFLLLLLLTKNLVPSEEIPIQDGTQSGISNISKLNHEKTHREMRDYLLPKIRQMSQRMQSIILSTTKEFDKMQVCFYQIRLESLIDLLVSKFMSPLQKSDSICKKLETLSFKPDFNFIVPSSNIDDVKKIHRSFV